MRGGGQPGGFGAGFFLVMESHSKIARNVFFCGLGKVQSALLADGGVVPPC